MSRIVGLSNVCNPGAVVETVDAMGAAVDRTYQRCATRVDASGVAMASFGSSSQGAVETDRSLLVVDGYVFNKGDFAPASNDAELIARSCEEHGLQATLERLNGDFALAYYDKGCKRLQLARDRFGLKPLYYSVTGGRLAFASRMASLFCVDGISRDVNRRFVAVFAASHYRYIDNHPEESPFADIAQLPRATILTFEGSNASTLTYWQLTEQADFDGTEEELAERYRELLLDAVEVRRRVASDCAFTLSGGMDSSSVLACAVHTSGSKQHALSTVYEDKTYDEADDIKTILDDTVEKWTPVQVDVPDVLSMVAKMVQVHDEPIATATWLSHYMLCEAASTMGYKGLFGGLGGDEINAGEYEYYFFHFADLRRAGNEEQLALEVEKWKAYHDHPIYTKNAEVMEQALLNMVDLDTPGACLPDLQRMKKYYGLLNPEFYELESFDPTMESPFSSYLKNRTFQDMTRETAPCCLRAEDRQAVAFGLDNFLPFFDHRLAEFMFRVPGNYKIRDGITKRLLRTATDGILPDDTRNRIKKTGWNAPAHIWFSDDGRDQLMDLVRSTAFQNRGLYRQDAVEKLIDEHCDIVKTGRAVDNHMMFLWQLVNTECWFRHVVEA